MNDSVTQSSENPPVAPLIIRGQRIAENLIEVSGRGEEITFLTPDARKYANQIGLSNPGAMAELYDLSFEDILDYLEKVGEALDISTNIHLQRARDLSCQTSPLTPPIIDEAYGKYLQPLFDRDLVRLIADKILGIPYLEGWVEDDRPNGIKLQVRCFGPRSMHIVAGNVPQVAAGSIINSIILRGDAILKTPSNDPFTALAIAETMCDVAPDHPITRSVTVGYWRGGDEELEKQLYQPKNLEKIVAWGGLSAVRHVTQYIQPGLEMIAMDPKLSMSIVGPEAFESEENMQDVAKRIARDVGEYNQAGCSNARVIYVQSGTDEEDIEKLNRLGRMAYEAMLQLPEGRSTRPKTYDQALKAHVDALRYSEEWYKVIGGQDNEGAVIVSQLPDKVEFSRSLDCRTCNLVPIDSLEEATRELDAYAQTVGVYPESLQSQLRDVMPLFGAQRIVPLGCAMAGTCATPLDGMEPLRRMGRWIANEIYTEGSPFDT